MPATSRTAVPGAPRSRPASSASSSTSAPPGDVHEHRARRHGGEEVGVDQPRRRRRGRRSQDDHVRFGQAAGSASGVISSSAGSRPVGMTPHADDPGAEGPGPHRHRPADARRGRPPATWWRAARGTRAAATPSRPARRRHSAARWNTSSTARSTYSAIGMSVTWLVVMRTPPCEQPGEHRVVHAGPEDCSQRTRRRRSRSPKNGRTGASGRNRSAVAQHHLGPRRLPVERPVGTDEAAVGLHPHQSHAGRGRVDAVAEAVGRDLR